MLLLIIDFALDSHLRLTGGDITIGIGHRKFEAGVAVAVGYGPLGSSGVSGQVGGVDADGIDTWSKINSGTVCVAIDSCRLRAAAVDADVDRRGFVNGAGDGNKRLGGRAVVGRC